MTDHFLERLAADPSIRLNEELFRSYVPQGAPDECWEWTGTRSGRMRYGVFGFWLNGEYKQTRAHRLAYYLAHNQWPGDLFVCHACDNPPCVNPAHLWLGTNADNQRDKNEKGRHRSAPLKLLCPQGHVKDMINAAGVNACRTCVRASQRVTARRLREERLAELKAATADVAEPIGVIVGPATLRVHQVASRTDEAVRLACGSSHPADRVLPVDDGTPCKKCLAALGVAS